MGIESLVQEENLGTPPCFWRKEENPGWGRAGLRCRPGPSPGPGPGRGRVGPSDPLVPPPSYPYLTPSATSPTPSLSHLTDLPHPFLFSSTSPLPSDTSLTPSVPSHAPPPSYPYHTPSATSSTPSLSYLTDLPHPSRPSSTSPFPSDTHPPGPSVAMSRTPTPLPHSLRYLPTAQTPDPPTSLRGRGSQQSLGLTSPPVRPLANMGILDGGLANV